MVRMPAPGSASLHQIRPPGQWTSRDASDFLCPSKRAWRMPTSNRRGQPNRWRLSDWTAACERHRTAVVEAEVPTRAPVSAATREFRPKSLEDLSAYNARILAIKAECWQELRRRRGENGRLCNEALGLRGASQILKVVSASESST